MIPAHGTVLKVLLSNARFLASLRPWSPGTAGSRSWWSSTVYTQGPTGSVQDNNQQRPGADQASLPAALQSVRHQSSCTSSSGSSRKVQQRQQAQLRMTQPQQGEQQQCRQQPQLDNWIEGLEIIEQQVDKQIFRGGVVTPVEGTPLWRETFYGNVPSQWWPKDSSSKSALLQAPAGSSNCRRDSSTSTGSTSTSYCSSGSTANLPSSQDDPDFEIFADHGNCMVFAGSRNGTNTTSDSIPSWHALVNSSSSAISSLFRVSQYPKPQPYWRDGQVCYGNKPVVLVQRPPAAEFNRAARAQLMQQLRPLYPGGNSSIRVAYAERSARAVRRQQQRAARQEQQKQLGDTFTQLMQLSHQQVLGEVGSFQRVASDWKRLIKDTDHLHLLLKHRPSNAFAHIPIDTKDVRQQRLARTLELVWRRFTAQQQKLWQQRRFRLRSHLSVAAAAAVLSKEYPERKRLLLQEPEAGQQLENRAAESMWNSGFPTRPPAASDIPGVGVISTHEEAAQYLASCGTVYRCTARRDNQGAVLPLPRHCIPGYCSMCSHESSSSSSTSTTQQHHQQQPEGEAETARQQHQQPLEVGSVVLQKQQKQQQHRRQRSKSACVAGLGCDAIVKRGRKRTSRAKRHFGWWASDLLKFRQHPRQTYTSAHSKLSVDTATVPATATADAEASLATADSEAVSTPTTPSTVDLVQEQQQQQQLLELYCGSSDSRRSFSGTGFVILEACDVDSDDSDWDDESDNDTDYDSESDGDDGRSDDEDNELLFEEEQLSPETQWALEEPYVFRNSVGVIYGFWSKCPMG